MKRSPSKTQYVFPLKLLSFAICVFSYSSWVPFTIQGLIWLLVLFHPHPACAGISQDKLLICSDLKTAQQCSDPEGCFMAVGASRQSLSLQGSSLHFTFYPMQDALNQDILLSCTLIPNARSVLLTTEAASPNHSFHWRHNPLLPT